MPLNAEKFQLDKNPMNKLQPFEKKPIHTTHWLDENHFPDIKKPTKMIQYPFESNSSPSFVYSGILASCQITTPLQKFARMNGNRQLKLLAC